MPALRRLIPPARGSSAGLWVLPDQQLLLARREDHWQVQQLLPWSPQRPRDWRRRTRLQRLWLARHGLDRACFPTRRAARESLECALQGNPPCS